METAHSQSGIRWESPVAPKMASSFAGLRRSWRKKPPEHTVLPPPGAPPHTGQGARGLEGQAHPPPFQLAPFCSAGRGRAGKLHRLSSKQASKTPLYTEIWWKQTKPNSVLRGEGEFTLREGRHRRPQPDGKADLPRCLPWASGAPGPQPRRPAVCPEPREQRGLGQHACICKTVPGSPFLARPDHPAAMCVHSGHGHA